MLTSTKRKYTKICTIKAKEPERTNLSIAEEMGISDATVERALVWGNRIGIFDIQADEQLKREIGELQEIVKRLEARYKALDRRCKKIEGEGKTAPIHFLTAIAKTLLDYRTRLAELQGIYKKTLNLNQSGEVTVKFVNDFKDV